MNQTFSIDDIKEEQKLNRFFITDQEIAIENILEDSDLLINNSEAMLSKIENIIQFNENGNAVSYEPEEINDIITEGGEDK